MTDEQSEFQTAVVVLKTAEEHRVELNNELALLTGGLPESTWRSPKYDNIYQVLARLRTVTAEVLDTRKRLTTAKRNKLLDDQEGERPFDEVTRLSREMELSTYGKGPPPTQAPLPNPILSYFAFDHLPLPLQAISQPLGKLALEMNAMLPECAEKSAGLRKLLEAKDCFVRANLPQPKA